MAEHRPDIVVNAAAYNQVDVAEREPLVAFQVNALAVRHIAVACRLWDAKLVHYSTDYVFDGRAGRPYTEADATHPLGPASRSWASSARRLPRNPHLPTSGVPDPAALCGEGNFVEMMLARLEDKPIRVVRPALTRLRSGAVTRSVDLMRGGLHGIIHAGKCSGFPVRVRAPDLPGGRDGGACSTTNEQNTMLWRGGRVLGLSI
jgi:dTDP-4-dehydrorhamnose reductase